MSKQIEKIALILENCEVIEIDSKYIRTLDLTDITSNVYQTTLNHIQEYKRVKSFTISINREANNGFAWNKKSYFERLNCYNDIGSITIYYNNGDNDNIYLTWYEAYVGDNKYQKSCINKMGDLFIVVDKDLQIEDVFPLEELDNEEYTKHLWAMLD